MIYIIIIILLIIVLFIMFNHKNIHQLKPVNKKLEHTTWKGNGIFISNGKIELFPEFLYNETVILTFDTEENNGLRFTELFRIFDKDKLILEGTDTGIGIIQNNEIIASLSQINSLIFMKLLSDNELEFIFTQTTLDNNGGTGMAKLLLHKVVEGTDT